MTITADSGSTKTTWKISDGVNSWFISTQGLNPYHQSMSFISDVIQHELINNADFPPATDITDVCFYGAGCTVEKSPIIRTILQRTFQNATHIEVASDMLGAAKALFGDQEGIACILGTGANTCLYDGQKIVSNVSPMGYILGDEGSGAVLGKTYINQLYKGLHHEDILPFQRETGLTQSEIIQKVYREPMPNRFLASLCPYIKSQIETEWVKKIVIDCFTEFFAKNVRHYDRPDLSCSFVGSIAYYFADELHEAAKTEGYTIGKIQKEPLTVNS